MNIRYPIYEGVYRILTVEKLLMNNNPDDGVTGGATLWKLTQGITAFAREQQPERCRELHEISGQLMNRVKIN